METLKKIYKRNKELDHIFMEKYEKIAMAPIPNEGVGLAINDRIKRASR